MSFPDNDSILTILQFPVCYVRSMSDYFRSVAGPKYTKTGRLGLSPQKDPIRASIIDRPKDVFSVLDSSFSELSDSSKRASVGAGDA